jgi:putative endonuclease
MNQTYYVYILTNKSLHSFYIGVTNNLARRLAEHRDGKSEWTSQYNVTIPVYVEETDNAYDAISREKQLKGWTRQRKLELIKSVNPTFEEIKLEA